MSNKYVQCFYCRALISKENKQMDHFPKPKRHGGTETVPSCTTCHDMKDRFVAIDWPIEFIAPIWRDLENSSREMRIFFGKVMDTMFDIAEHQKLKEKK